MYLNILKKDLKRKKTMNFISVVFMILSVMFMSSSTNTLLSITTALDNFFEKAETGNYFTATIDDLTSKNVEMMLDETPSVKSYKSENIFYILENGVEYNGKNLSISSTGIVNCIDDIGTKIFKNDGSELKEIKDGYICCTNSFIKGKDIEIGSKIKVTIGNVTKEFIVQDGIKDAIFGSAMMSSPRFILNRNDFDSFKHDNLLEHLSGKIFNIFTDNISEIEQKLSNESAISFNASISTLKLSYIMDTIIAGMFLVVSICLIIIALVILKFTISFTLSEEYREIGIMKAIGISNSKIRILYIIKYLVMAFVSAIAGFFLGIPFENMLLSQASQNILINTSSNISINIICSALVAFLIIFFCHLSTGKINKFTPVDAIRNGETGKRYKKKGILSLSKSHIKPMPFMALNDILSGLRHFIIMIATFTVGMLIIMIMLNVMSTVSSPKLMAWFSQAECDICLEDLSAKEKFTSSDGRKLRAKAIEDIQKNLNNNGIPSECFAESILRLSIESDSYKTKCLTFQGINITTERYTYIDGTAPINENEIALTYITADKLNVKIGDTVKVSTGIGNEEYIVTAIYQGMNNMGDGIRLSEKLDLDYSQTLGFFSYQIKYTDSPTSQQIQERYDKIKELYPQMSIRTASEYVDYSIGGIADYMSGSKNLVVLIVIIINILVAILMQKSFIAKERSEIALLKAIGFKNRSVIFWQTLRIAIVMFISIILSIILSEPVSQLSTGGIFKMMGAYNIVFDVDVIGTYFIYPFIVFAATILAVFLCNLSVRKISSSEVNNIE